MNRKRLLNIGVFCFLLFAMFLWPSIPIIMFNIPYDKLSLTTQVIYRFLCDLVFIAFIFYIYRDKIVNDCKSYFKKFRDNFETSFKYYFIGALVMMASNLIITLCFSNATAGNEEAVRSMIDDAPLYMLFSVSIYAPFTEEMLFRHAIKNCVVLEKKKNKFTKLLFAFISGFIFALLHILGQATGIIDYLYIIPYMSLGFVFGLLYYDTDNIFSSIMMHAFHNTVTIILYFTTGGII